MTRDRNLSAAVVALRHDQAERLLSEHAKAVLKAVEHSDDAHKAWKRLSFKPSPTKPVDHAEVLLLTIRSFSLAADPDALNTLVQRKQAQFRSLIACTENLISYFKGEQSEALAPSTVKKDGLYDTFVKHLEEMHQTLFLYSIFEISDALEVPQRPSKRRPSRQAKKPDLQAQARTFEHVLSTYLAKRYAPRSFSDYVLGISKVLYPGVAGITARMLQLNRKKDANWRAEEMRKLDP